MLELGDIIPQNALATGLCVLFIGCGGLLTLLVLSIRAYRNPPRLSELEANINARSWTWYDAGLIVGILLMVWTVAMLSATILTKLGHQFSAEVSPAAVFLSVFIFHIPALLAVTAIAMRRRMSLFDAFGIRCEGLTAVLTKGILYCVAALPVLWLITILYDLVLSAFGIPLEPQTVVSLFLSSDAHHWSFRLALVLLAVIFVPITEELLFRGVLFPAMAKQLGVIAGSLIVSVMFALLHRNIPSLAPLFVLSLILCFASARTGTVLVPIVMHSTFNLVHIALMLIMRG